MSHDGLILECPGSWGNSSMKQLVSRVFLLRLTGQVAVQLSKAKVPERSGKSKADNRRRREPILRESENWRRVLVGGSETNH